MSAADGMVHFRSLQVALQQMAVKLDVDYLLQVLTFTPQFTTIIE